MKMLSLQCNAFVSVQVDTQNVEEDIVDLYKGVDSIDVDPPEDIGEKVIKFLG
jgi:hypothetical protein